LKNGLRPWGATLEGRAGGEGEGDTERSGECKRNGPARRPAGDRKGR